MSIAYSFVPGLLLIGGVMVVQLLFPQASQSFIHYVVRIGALIIQL